MTGLTNRVVIINDNNENNWTLEQLLINHFKERIKVKVFSCAENAIFEIVENEPDLIVLNCDLPGSSGVALLQTLKKLQLPCKVLLASAFKEKAIHAIKHQAEGFITIPSSPETIGESITEILDSLNTPKLPPISQFKASEKIKVAASGGFRLFNLKKLAYCEADGSYTQLHFTDGRKEYSTFYLGKIEKILTPHLFARINRSTIINIRFLERIDRMKDLCTIDVGGQSIDIATSKSKIKKLKEANIVL